MPVTRTSAIGLPRGPLRPSMRHAWHAVAIVPPAPPDPALARRLLDRFGAPARPWLDALPALAGELAERWRLTLDGDVGGGGTAAGRRCRRRDDGRGAVLKLTPEVELAAAEGDALAIWGGRAGAEPGARAGGGVVAEAAGGGRREHGSGAGGPDPVPALWARDDAAGALLLEAIGDGRSIADGQRMPPAERVGALLRALHAAPTPADDGPSLTVDGARPDGRVRDGRQARDLARPVPSLRERIDFVFALWLRRRDESDVARARVPEGLLEAGHAAAAALAEDGRIAPVLLHGDLHPGNVLDGGATRGLVAIDPRACAGDPAFDAIDWILWRADGLELVERRIAALAPAAGVEGDRLHAWCAAFAAMVAVSLARQPPARDTEARLATLLTLATPSGPPPARC
jgi:streptomycin 6-kinase